MLVGAVLQAAAQKAPIASQPVIEVSGRITAVGLARGQGVPSLELKTPEGRVWKVWLGSMRYLLEQNFNPKAGQEAAVKGYKGPGADEVTAISVTLLETKQTIRLRDDDGRPLWRGQLRGRYRGGR
jgi:hypothetical protein